MTNRTHTLNQPKKKSNYEKKTEKISSPSSSSSKLEYSTYK